MKQHIIFFFCISVWYLSIFYVSKYLVVYDSDASDICLQIHNDIRRNISLWYSTKYKLVELEWDMQLEYISTAWSEYLEKTGNFRHGIIRHGVPTPDGDVDMYGQNLYKNTGGARCDKGILAWTAERFSKKWSPTKKISNDADFHEYGHFTQIAWNNTLKVGCNLNGIVITCMYYPAGNGIGQLAFNLRK